MSKPEEISPEEFQRLAAEALERNRPLLEALARPRLPIGVIPSPDMLVGDLSDRLAQVEVQVTLLTQVVLLLKETFTALETLVLRLLGEEPCSKTS